MGEDDFEEVIKTVKVAKDLDEVIKTVKEVFEK